MKCKAESNPSPSYTWTRGTSQQVEWKEMIKFLLHPKAGTGNTLTLTASSHTGGLYYCHATVEGFKTATSQPAELQVIMRPKIDIGSKVI